MTLKSLWVSNPKTGRFPPLRVAWHLAWAVPLYTSITLLTLLLLIAQGRKSAMRFWEDMT